MAYNNGSADTGVCILAKQVFSECYQKECMLYDMDTTPSLGGPNATILDIVFSNGNIQCGPSNVTLTPVQGKTDIFVADFTVEIPYVVTYKPGGCPNEQTANGKIEIPKKIYLRIPVSQVREEYEFEYDIQTESMVVGEPFYAGPPGPNKWRFTVGSTIVIKVLGIVQLQVLTTGYCPVPCECEDVDDDDNCEEFLNAPFPDDFFPPIPDDLCPRDC